MIKLAKEREDARIKKEQEEIQKIEEERKQKVKTFIKRIKEIRITC